jgi:hypothetical protein
LLTFAGAAAATGAGAGAATATASVVFVDFLEVLGAELIVVLVAEEVTEDI